jgi:hypothetical protein
VHLLHRQRVGERLQRVEWSLSMLTTGTRADRRHPLDDAVIEHRAASMPW